jgi:hypothetical protein
MAKKGSSLWIPGKDSDFTVSYIIATPLVDLNHASELYSDPRLSYSVKRIKKLRPDRTYHSRKEAGIWTQLKWTGVSARLR